MGNSDALLERADDERWQFRDLVLFEVKTGDYIRIHFGRDSIRGHLNDREEGTVLIVPTKRPFYGVIALHGTVEQVRLLLPIVRPSAHSSAPSSSAQSSIPLSAQSSVPSSAPSSVPSSTHSSASSISKNEYIPVSISFVVLFFSFNFLSIYKLHIRVSKGQTKVVQISQFQVFLAAN